MASLQFIDEANGTMLEAVDFVVNAPENPASSSGPIAQANNFSPIGIGKPMTIKLLSVYAGDYKTGIFTDKKDLIVTSMIKQPSVAGIPPRALHQVYVNIPERELNIHVP